jgi:phosphatidylglycerol:prolipoprotein diacylglycerol transferase
LFYTLVVLHVFPSRAVALEIFGFGIHWYGILYVIAFLLAFAILPRIQKYRDLHLSLDDWSAVLTAGILGVLIGGRLGSVVLYHPAYYFAHPLEIFAVWRGGMSSHGGFLGVGLALLIVSRRLHIPLLALLDVAVMPAALGLAIGRIGNFINLELYGTVTTLPWGIAVPGVEGLRHPVQLYAIAKDLLIASVCFWHLRRAAAHLPGGTFAVFLMLYGLLRFLLEFVREPDVPLTILGPLAFTRGQLYTIPILIVGVGLWVWWRGITSAASSSPTQTP